MISDSVPHIGLPDDSLGYEASKWLLYESFKKDLRERCLEPDQYEIELRRFVDRLEL